MRKRPNFEKWQTVINLKFKGCPWKIRIGFSYEWKAWLIAYDLFDCSPEEFNKMPIDKQSTAVAYGAAAWDRIKKGKKVFFTYDNIVEALLKATKEENMRLVKALEYAQFPKWLKGDTGGKKKA